MAATEFAPPICRLVRQKGELLMLKRLAWVGWVGCAWSTLTHGPLLVTLATLVLAAVVLIAVVTTYVAAVFFTRPRKNLERLIKAWRSPRGGGP